MASSGSSTAASSGDRPGAAEEKANAARVSAASWSAAATAVANAAEAVGASADHWNQGIRNVVAARQRRDPQFAEASENDTAWVSAEQRGVKRTIAGEAKPPVLDWIELSRQDELQRFYRTNPGDAPQIIPGRTYCLLARV